METLAISKVQLSETPAGDSATFTFHEPGINLVPAPAMRREWPPARPPARSQVATGGPMYLSREHHDSAGQHNRWQIC